MSTLASLTEVKQFMGLVGSAEDTTAVDNTLNLLIVLASTFIQTEIGRTLLQDTYTQYYDGDGERDVILRVRPVQSITSVHVDSSGYYGDGVDPFPATCLLVAGVNYVLIRDDRVTATYSKSGLLRFISGGGDWFTRGELPPGYGSGLSRNIANRRLGWPRGQGNIKVVYVAGWPVASVPSDLKLACCLFVQTLKSQTDNNKFIATSESLTPYSYASGQLQYYAREVYGMRQVINKYKEISS